MSNESSALIADLFELNQRLSLNLWHMANEQGQPFDLSPHVIYPLKRDRTVRISEQEARAVCCGLLNNLSMYYSVETPTEQRYVQKGKRKEGMSGQTDLTIYVYDGQSLNRTINVEFKGPQASKNDIGKDIEKLVREGYQGNWFHILGNYNAGTFPALFSKFKYAFTEYPKLFSPEKLCSKKISILFCFCVLAKQRAYMRHFFYEPSQNGYEEYVTSFFNASNLDTHWHIFAKNVTAQTVVPNAALTRSSTVQKAWYYWQDHNGEGYIFAFVNSKGSCSLRRFKAESGEQLERVPNQKGNYQDRFAEYIESGRQLSLSRQPNLERDCKWRLPPWVQSELRKQIAAAAGQ